MIESLELKAKICDSDIIKIRDLWFNDNVESTIIRILDKHKWKIIITIVTGLSALLSAIIGAYVFVTSNFVDNLNYNNMQVTVSSIKSTCDQIQVAWNGVSNLQDRLCGCGYVGNVLTLTGPPGQNGATIITGSGPPSINQGLNGDIYIDTNSNYIYGPKSGNWSFLVSIGLPGPIGQQGLIGIQGIQGPTGLIGPRGETGSQGPVGPIGPTGLQGSMGLIGPQGVVGQTGSTGQQGVQGAQGVQGPQGVQGVAGPIGLMGPPGNCTGCAYGNSDNCCGVSCVVCPLSLSCIHGQCGKLVNAVNVYDGLSYTCAQGSFTYNQCNTICSTMFVGNMSSSMVYIGSSNQFQFTTGVCSSSWLSYIWNGNNYYSNGFVMTYSDWAGGEPNLSTGICVVYYMGLESGIIQWSSSNCYSTSNCLCYAVVS
jgi:hypothetical protein